MNDTNNTCAKRASLKLLFEYRTSFLRAWAACNIMDLDYSDNPRIYFELFANRMNVLKD